MAKCLIPENKLFEIHSELQKDFILLMEIYSNKFIQPYELVGTYILLYFSQAFPAAWKGSHKKEFFEAKSTFFPSQYFKKIQKIIPDATDIYTIFQKYRLRHISESAHRAIIEWANKKYPLNVRMDIPSSLEVLNYQRMNERIVTVFIPPPNSYVLGERDPLSFTLHDLIHADHFFSDPEYRKGQVGFYSWIYNNLTAFKEYHSDPIFLKNFDYLISDMNSISLHLIMSLKTILLHAYIRRQNLSIHYRLSAHEKLEFNGHFLKLFQASDSFSPIELKAFENLNEPTFDPDTDGKYILNFFNSYKTTKDNIHTL